MTNQQSLLVTELAKASGVLEADVAKVLEELGLSRALVEVERLKQGHLVDKSAARLALRVGRVTVMM